MRVTQSMLANNMLRNLSDSNEKMAQYQNQLATGKKITKPSDDPVIAMKGMTYRSNLQEVQQYKRNFTEANNWLDNSDSSLDEATQAMQRIRELTTQASNGTLDDTERKDISDEVKQLRDHIVDIANTKVGNKYIFNGTDTLNKPVKETTGADGSTAVTVSNNTKPVNIELSKGVYIQVNTNPQSVFSKDLFDNINSLIGDLDTNKNTSSITKYLDTLDNRINDIVSTRATIGARSNRIQLMEDRVDQQEVSATKMMSDNEDADTAKVITDLTTQESVQRAALSAGARIIQPTLLDFLK